MTVVSWPPCDFIILDKIILEKLDDLQTLNRYMQVSMDLIFHFTDNLHRIEEVGFDLLTNGIWARHLNHLTTRSLVNIVHRTKRKFNLRKPYASINLVFLLKKLQLQRV